MNRFRKELAALDAARNPIRPPLTKRQQEILSFVMAHQKRFGYPPTRAEIADAFGLWPTGIQQHLMLIQRKGYVKLSHAARAIEVINTESKSL